MILARCENGWSIFRNACYKFFNEKKDWNAADKACRQFGARLTSIHSKEEADFVRGLVDQSSFHNTWIGGYWGGYSFQWIDGSTFNFTYWDANEPKTYRDGREIFYCIEIRESSHKWNDKHCWNSLQNFVCKKQKGKLSKIVQ